MGYRDLVAPIRSSEIESVVRRLLAAWPARDADTFSNLFSTDASLRVVGTDPEEHWVGLVGFLEVFETQSSEMPDWQFKIESVEAFEHGNFGWATMFTTLTSPEAETSVRHTALFMLEAGAWRVIQWHNSVPVSNAQLFGVELTTTLDGLVASVLSDESHLAVAGSEGTMTLVFTDIVDSTALAETVGDVSWVEVISAHESSIRRITGSQGGTVVKFLGDGSMLSFESARSAVRASVEIQRPAFDTMFDVRIGIHTGEVMRTAGDLLGTTVNKAARVAAVAGAGEIKISSTTRDLVGSMDGIRIGEPETVALKGLSGTHQVVLINWD